MNPLHLLWIVPASAWLGAALLALFVGGDDETDECYYCPFPCDHHK